MNININTNSEKRLNGVCETCSRPPAAAETSPEVRKCRPLSAGSDRAPRCSDCGCPPENGTSPIGRQRSSIWDEDRLPSLSATFRGPVGQSTPVGCDPLSGTNESLWNSSSSSQSRQNSRWSATPDRSGSSRGTYDVSSPRNANASPAGLNRSCRRDTYDVPPPVGLNQCSRRGTYDVPPVGPNQSSRRGTYDVPVPVGSNQCSRRGTYDVVPPAPNNSRTGAGCRRSSSVGTPGANNSGGGGGGPVAFNIAGSVTWNTQNQ